MNIRQMITQKGDKMHEQGIEYSRLLSAGMFVNTKWNWEGIITGIDEKHFRHGQGVSITRIGDNAKFCIHPAEVAN